MSDPFKIIQAFAVREAHDGPIKSLHLHRRHAEGCALPTYDEKNGSTLFEVIPVDVLLCKGAAVVVLGHWMHLSEEYATADQKARDAALAKLSPEEQEIIGWGPSGYARKRMTGQL